MLSVVGCLCFGCGLFLFNYFLVTVRCLMLAVRCVVFEWSRLRVFVDCCLLFVFWCCCLVVVGRCALRVVCRCALFVVRCFSSVVVCRSLVALCLLFGCGYWLVIVCC